MTSLPLPRFTGPDFLVPVAGFLCRLCRTFYHSDSAARLTHCKSLMHFENFQVRPFHLQLLSSCDCLLPGSYPFGCLRNSTPPPLWFVLCACPIPSIVCFVLLLIDPSRMLLFPLANTLHCFRLVRSLVGPCSKTNGQLCLLERNCIFWTT